MNVKIKESCKKLDIIKGAQGTVQVYEQLVLLGYTHYCASTYSLSTWSSSTTLKRNLILRRVSRLYAFSAYPIPT